MAAPVTVRTGGYIDAFCTKCDLTLGHTVIAMVGSRVVKVHCNTCGADHAFRGEQAPAARAAGSASGAPSVKAGPSWATLMMGKDVDKARKYSMKEHFCVDDLVDHPTFGAGVVIAERSGKIDIVFEGAQKVLVNGAAPPSADPPARAPRGRPNPFRPQ
ncbi:MAG: hypothetical protein FJ087_17215 [Deltaproteobacteria bacterium]|nr:hypothetical protein [Deltaproteobacteria bacterium]